MIKIDTASLLQKEMDRKDFLKHVGIAVVALTGVSAALRLLADQPTQHMRQSAGYGSAVYGGKKPL